MFFLLPHDVQHWIFSLVPFATLERHYRSGHLGPAQVVVYESFIFQHLHFGNPWEGNPKHLLHDVSVRDLRKLARGQIKCHVRSLNLLRPSGCLDYEDLIKFCCENVGFLSAIPNIKFEGSFHTYLALKIFNLPGTRKIHVHGFPFKFFESPLPKIGLVRIPPNVESVHFEICRGNDLHFLSWPSLLRHLGVCIEEVPGSGMGYRSPVNLIALTSQGHPGSEWQKSPFRHKESQSKQLFPDFDSLWNIIERIDGETLFSFRQSRLSELRLSTSWARSFRFLEFVPNLRKLTLDSCRLSSLNVVLPKNLEVLDVHSNFISSLENFRFPPNLKELNLSHNDITNFAGVRFPNLTKLDISDLPIRNPEQLIALPETLTHLYARGTHLNWPATNLPNLIVLEICCLSVNSLNLPQTLRILRLCIDRFDYFGEQICFPPELTSLTLRFGDDLGSECCDYSFHHIMETEPREALPESTLSSLEIPKSVRFAELRAQNEKCFRDLILPDELEELVSDYPVKHLPENLMWLKFEKSESPIFRLDLPNLVALDLGYVNCKIDLRGVPNLQIFKGSRICNTVIVNSRNLRVLKW